MVDLLLNAVSGRFVRATGGLTLLAGFAVWIVPAGAQLAPANPATTGTQRTIQLDRPIFINLPCPDEALKLLLLSEEGIMWNPEGRIGNQQLSEIVSEVRVVYPGVDKLQHREELVNEILGLLKLAREGNYIPPSQRQGALRPTASFPNVFEQQQTQGGLAQNGRQDSTLIGDRFTNPANNAASNTPALNPGSMPDRFQGSASTFGNSVVAQPQNFGAQSPAGGSQLQINPSRAGQLTTVNPLLPRTTGSNGWDDRNATQQQPITNGFNLQASQQPGSGLFNSGVAGPRPPALAVPNRGTTGISGFSQPIVNPSQFGSQGQNQPANGLAWNQPTGNGFNSQASPLSPVASQPVSSPPGMSSTPPYVAELANELIRMREQVEYQNSRLNQMQLDNQSLQQTNQTLQQNLASAQYGPGYAQLPSSPGLYTSTGTDLTASNSQTLANNGGAPPQRRGGTTGSAPASLGLAAAIAGPTLDDANHQTLLERQNMLLWLFLAASIGLNIYLAMIARGLYVRYGDLADELRETFTATA